MDDTSRSRLQPMRVKQTVLVLALVWTTAIGALLGWSLWYSNRHAEELARLEASASINKDLLYRRWASANGGVYAPVTEASPPNPYLSDVNDRDITTPAGRKLTLINPAYMTRQVHEMGLKQFGARGHITSLNPLRPENAPDAWEAKALHVIAEGAPEVASVETLDDAPHLRLMRPLVTEQSCLGCHAKQGYQVGDIRGGISVSVPMGPYNEIERAHTMPLMLGHGLFWVFGLLWMSLAAWRHWDRMQEREQTQEAVRQSEQRMELALQGGDLGTWDWHVPRGQVTYNERWAEMLGYTLDECAPRVDAWDNVLHHDDKSRVWNSLNAHLEGKTDSYEVEYRLRHKSGDWVWVLSKGRVIERDADGKPVRVCGTHLDVTERKRLHAAHEERLALLTVLFESMQAGVLVEDANRQVLFANEQFCDMFGRPAPNAEAGRDGADSAHAAANLFQDPGGFVASSQARLAARAVVASEALEMVDGRVLERTYAPVFRDHQFYGHLWLYRDKTAQIRMERDYHMLFREMLNGFAVHEIICDAAGHPIDYRFLDINPAFERMTGLGRDIIGKTVLEVMPGTDHRWIEAYGHVALTGEPAAFDRAAAEFSKHFAVTAFRPAPNQFACIFIDITEHKREERVRATLLRLNAFSADHDVSELLQAVLDEAEALTGSVLGFYHFLEEDQETVSLQAWSTSTRNNECKAKAERSHYPVSQAGVWVDCVHEGTPVIHNDYASLPHAKGMPAGHAVVVRELVVPVNRGHTIVAILGVGNKPFDYNDEDVKTIQRLADLAWELVVRKQAEVALRENEARMRSLFQAAPIGIGLVSNRVLLDMNDRLCEIIGYSRDELVGQHARILHPTDADYEKVSKDMYGQIALRGTGAVLTRFKRKDGAIIDVQLNSTPLNPADLSAALTFTVLDITERKRAEEDRERLMSAIEQAAEAVVITGSDGTIQYVNPAFVRVTGYSRDEAVGQNPRILNSGEHDDAFYQSMWAALRNGETWNGQFVNKRKDGSLFTEQAIISPVRDASGEIVNYVAVKRDITEEIALEEQYRQAQKMEFVGRLAGGVAHDFNNMLGVILGHAEMAMGLVGDNHPACDNLVEIDKAAHRSADLTRQLLAFARRQTVSPQVLNLNSTVEGMLKMLQRLIGENIDLAWIPGAGLWPIWMDPSQLDQVLANVCVNARDAIEGVGAITIQTENACLDATYRSEFPALVPGDYVRLEVSDTGCGMDDQTLSHAFEPFFTTKGSGKGTGLGLATVYGIIKQNHGFVDIRSERGRGTAIAIYLPRTVKSLHEPDTPIAVWPDATGDETLLLVEDQPALMMVAKAMLESLGYPVITAATPHEAMELAEKHASSIQLVITDVIMPEMNGRDLAGRLQADHPKLKFLFMSGYTADVIAPHGVLEGGVNFIQKPFTRNELAAKVREALGHRSDAD